METYNLLHALSEDLREQFGELPEFISSDLDSRKAAAVNLKNSLLSKWAPKGVSSLAARTALDLFLRANDQCGLRAPDQVGDEHLLNAFSRHMEDLFGWRVVDDSASLFSIVSDHLAPGPGASLRHNNRGGFLEKYFQGPLSVTSEWLLSVYRAMIFRTPNWAAAEWQRFQEFGVEVIGFSKLFFVPKKATVARVCCTEPGVNMLLQRGISWFIEERLKEIGIDISTQADLNKRLAQLGSSNDSFVTLDQTSASDSVSLQLVRKYVPAPLRSWLEHTRSPRTVLPDGRIVELKMVSSMGNGFTFSLMTGIISCAVKACHTVKGLPFRTDPLKDWGVFGDDVICSKELVTSVKRLLYLLGFTVNEDKSFTAGSFRESCGGDYFRGIDIRGVYLRRLDSGPLVYSAINRLNRWSTRHGIILRRTVKFLLSLIRGPLLVVPRSEGDDAGLHVPSEHTRYLVGEIPSYRAFRAVPSQRRFSPSGGEALGYGFAIAVSLVGGYMSSPETSLTDKSISGRIVVDDDFLGPESEIELLAPLRNQGPVRYRKVLVSTLYWDWHGLRTGDLGHRDDSWGAIVWLNCFSSS